jgi:hypothetical protein
MKYKSTELNNTHPKNFYKDLNGEYAKFLKKSSLKHSINSYFLFIEQDKKFKQYK